MSKILIIDDERGIRNTLKEILADEGHEVEVAENGMQGLEMAQAKAYDLIFSDIKMPEMDGMEFLAKLKNGENDANDANGECPVVMITGHGDVETAVQALKLGAYDFLLKPLDLNRILITTKNALESKSLKQETKQLRKKVAAKGPQMIGESAAIAAAIPSELIESELFGHMKGSFTGAVKDRAGKFEQADGGTLFLDEIGDMSLAAQTKVLRALQESEITRVGSDKAIKVNVRVLAATNKDLQKEIAEGNFREDLFHRLNVIPVAVPALNDRIEDIPLLVNYFVEQICDEQGIAKKSFEPEAIKALQAKQWTGNIQITAEDVNLYA